MSQSSRACCSKVLGIAIESKVRAAVSDHLPVLDTHKEKMDLYRFFILLSLACSCTAGPVVAVIGMAIGEILGDTAAEAVVGSSIAEAVGVGASAVWYGDFVIVNGALYYGTGAAAAGALAAGAGKWVMIARGAMRLTQALPAGAAAGVAKITDKQLSKSIMASISAVSHASVVSVDSVSKASASRAAASKTGVVAALPTKTHLPPVKGEYYAAIRPSTFTFSAVNSKHSGPAPTTPAPKPPSPPPPAATTPAPKPSIPPPPAPKAPIPPPPGTPVSSLPPDARPSEVPAGVPEYNFRMCQYDIMKMGQNNQNLTFDNPEGYSESLL